MKTEIETDTWNGRALLTDLYCNFQGEYRMAGLDPILYISDRPVWNARPGTYH